jgi:hypothetical protein
MDAIQNLNRICCLCGSRISANPVDPNDALSWDHVPPKQFYPKEMRATANPNLWLVPTHKRCNGDCRMDEEYFYHAVYPLVQNGNPSTAQVVHRDLIRRTKQPQTPAMARKLLKEFRMVTKAGIYLPAGIVQFNLDEYRLQRVVIKIAQGLYYRDRQAYMPRTNCKDIRLCEHKCEVPELYELSWCGTDAKSVMPGVFSYRHLEFDNLHLFSMLFWEAFLFCAAFENPSIISAPAA